jgi:hypothetical protein
MRDPLVGRVPGALVIALAVHAYRLAPRTATGLRRAVARLGAALAALVGALHLAGPELLDVIDVAAPAGLRALTRAWLAAALVGAASGWAWWTSPAVRG